MTLKYRLSALGWYNFELPVQTLLKVTIGPGVASFGGTKDHGRDARFVGTSAFPSPQTSCSGEWVFQVKYIETDSESDAQKRIRHSLSK